MADTVEMEILQAQIEELRERMETLGIGEVPRSHSKDVSLVAGIKEWTGESKGNLVLEFLTQIGTLAKVSGWTGQDKALIVKAKLQGLALQFLHGREELGRDGCSYEILKQALAKRFSDKLPNQYCYTRLQEAVQGKEEGAEEFSDRCRKMCQKTIRRVKDEGRQRIINEEAERRLLAAYIHGLEGIVWQQVQFQMPSTMEQAVRLAVTVENVERLRQMREGPRKVFTAQSEIKCFHCAGIGHYARECLRNFRPEMSGRKSWNNQHDRRMDGNDRESQAPRGSRNNGGPSGQGPRRQARPLVPPGNNRRLDIQCFNCQEFGHMRRDCPKVNRASQYPNGQGSTLRSPASNPPPTRN
jgi:hypothetical protein